MSLVSLAARNNAEWCDIVCKSHNIAGVFKDDIWVNSHEVPVYYPNFITLSEDADLSEIETALQTREGPWSLKDSFNKLDLTRLGFEKLFEAEWLLAPKKANAEVEWSVIGNENELKAWARAWDAEQPDMFNTELLNRADIKSISIYADEKIVAGAIINKASGIVGLSNIFCNAEDKGLHWTALVAAANDLFPGLDVIGYESGDELELAQTIGFKKLGPLSVWVKN